MSARSQRLDQLLVTDALARMPDGALATDLIDPTGLAHYRITTALMMLEEDGRVHGDFDSAPMPHRRRYWLVSR